MKTTMIITWWTIDSYFNPLTDSVETLEKSCLPHYINSLKMEEEVEYIDVCMKDSRALQKEDLEQVLNYIEESTNDRFIVTHGTYTMPDTARYISLNISDSNKKVVLIWSMIPLTWFSPSDAWFNLWYALASLDYVAWGVYVGMNGKLFKAEEVSKLISEWRFVSLFNK